MFDLRKIFDLRKFFAVPKNFLKSKIHCSTINTEKELLKTVRFGQIKIIWFLAELLVHLQILRIVIIYIISINLSNEIRKLER